ncbi:MAG: hypothetical protein M0C28_45665 [Candidatus Moduliflexus flocculans]|nr:hypothetical protein [Candidatus Moduliflexus flocculans]
MIYLYLLSGLFLGWSLGANRCRQRHRHRRRHPDGAVQDRRDPLQRLRRSGRGSAAGRGRRKRWAGSDR